MSDINEARVITNEKRIMTTVKALRKNNMDARYFANKDELIKALEEMIPEGASTALGGTTTVKQIPGLENFIKGDRHDFRDRKAPAETKEEEIKVKADSTFVDYYFLSANAITTDGIIYNVDGHGNRVAAMIWGPENVVIIATPNKIVNSIEGAIERNRAIAAPMNCERLNKPTPCAKTGTCMDCKVDERICIFYTATGFQRVKNRIKVFFLNEELGY